ncbi:hypothetical protein DVH26_15025 [Paenibacillus sp. H1-7]|nr:hypothetical protein DVH26_15025 [Paenibacillus sp. H1-7]
MQRRAYAWPQGPYPPSPAKEKVCIRTNPEEKPNASASGFFGQVFKPGNPYDKMEMDRISAQNTKEYRSMKNSPYLVVSIINLLAAVAFVFAGWISSSNLVKYGFMIVAVLFLITCFLNYKKYKSGK